LTLGWWSTLADLVELQPEADTFYPRMQTAEAEARYAEWKVAVQRARLREVQA
jgi:glycerol kinase